MISDLDLNKVGHAVVMLGITSRTLGHTDAYTTARDYLAPHAVHSPEVQFVVDLFTRPVRDVVTEDEMIFVVTNVELPPLPPGLTNGQAVTALEAAELPALP